MSSPRKTKTLSKVEDPSSEGETEEEVSMPDIWSPFNHVCAEGFVALMLQKKLVNTQHARDQVLAAIHEAMPALDFHYSHWMDGPGTQQAKPPSFRRFYNNFPRILRYTGLCATVWVKYLEKSKYPLPPLPNSFEIPATRAPDLDLSTRPDYESLSMVLFHQDGADDEAEEGLDEEDDNAEEALTENHPRKSSGGRASRGPRPSPAATEVASPETPPKQPSRREVPPVASTKAPRVLRSGNPASGSANKSKTSASSASNKSSGKRKASTSAPAEDEEEVDARAKKSHTTAAEPSDDDMKDEEDAESEVDDQKTTHADSGKGPKLDPIKSLVPRNIGDQVTKVLEKRFSRKKVSKEEFPQINVGLGPTHPYFYSFVAIRRPSDAPAATFYSHIPPKAVARQTGRVQYQPIFKDAPLIDAKPIRTVKLEEGILCFNCNKLRIRCGDRMTVPERVRLNQEFAEGYAIASDVTETVLGELVQSFDCASSIAKIYDEAIIDLQVRLRHATDHVAKCVSHMGAEVFVQRFQDCSEEDSVVDFLNLLLASTSGFEGPSKTTSANLIAKQLFEWLKFRTGPSFNTTWRRVVEYDLLYEHVPAVFAYFRDSFPRVMLEYYSSELDKYNDLTELQNLEQEWVEHRSTLSPAAAFHYPAIKTMLWDRKPSSAWGECKANNFTCIANLAGLCCKQCEVTLYSKCGHRSYEAFYFRYLEEDNAFEKAQARSPDYAGQSKLAGWRTLYPYVEEVVAFEAFAQFRDLTQVYTEYLARADAHTINIIYNLLKLQNSTYAMADVFRTVIRENRFFESLKTVSPQRAHAKSQEEAAILEQYRPLLHPNGNFRATVSHLTSAGIPFVVNSDIYSLGIDLTSRSIGMNVRADLQAAAVNKVVPDSGAVMPVSLASSEAQAELQDKYSDLSIDVSRTVASAGPSQAAEDFVEDSGIEDDDAIPDLIFAMD
ncbi:hypothetical protein DFH09DRAFT_1113001 [Mycena vulgaris]|nr:hypothetical protein DFH09DRAFT_1113001 [Mycena vulgaris]